MDLSGRSDGYRAETAICPQCGAMMRAEAVPSARVDVCDPCGGLWLDWFDGDVPTLAAEAEEARVARGATGPAALGGQGQCPRCHRRLEVEYYRFPDASAAELVDGVELLRCAECAGAFVSRPSARLLLARLHEAPVVTLWEALVARLKRLVGARFS